MIFLADPFFIYRYCVLCIFFQTWHNGRNFLFSVSGTGSVDRLRDDIRIGFRHLAGYFWIKKLFVRGALQERAFIYRLSGKMLPLNDDKQQDGV
jgi:hypothetical protein